ncbi:MAG: D-alanyl-D-alanine carboxypeptidase/D-alanyl-D-alanine-endopeptidase [Pseudoruegeria sp.]
MSTQLTRRFFLGSVASGLATQAFANAPVTSLRPLPRGAKAQKINAKSADGLIRAAKLGGDISFVVADANTGEVLEVKNPIQALPPASVAKSLTALYALDKLGEDHRFRTRILMTGSLENGRLNGDLILAGDGDPLLNTDALGNMAKAMKTAGVVEVTGEFYVYDNALPYVDRIDVGQPDHLGYNPAICGLNLNFNRVHFQWKKASGRYSVTMDARAKHYNPAVQIAKMSIVDRSAPIYTYAAAGTEDHWTVAKRALGNGGARWLPVRHPGLYAGEVFQTIARSHGVVLKSAKILDQLPDAQELTGQDGAVLSNVIQGMLKYSTNLTAEVLGLAASEKAGVAPDGLAQSAQAMNTWLKTEMGARDVAFVDHSGLGEESRISAYDMVDALQKAHPKGQLRPLLKTIAVKNDRGEVLNNHPVKIVAKTGTLNFVSALSGYATTPNGRDLIFAIFTAELDRRAKIGKADRERPEGARSWAARSRRLQQQLIRRWTDVYEV